MTQEEREVALTLSDFNESIKKFTLFYKDPDMEKEYREKRIDPLTVMRFFKILFIILAVILALRRIEALTFAYMGIESDAAPRDVEKVNVIALAVVCLAEATIALTRKIWILKGFFFMIYIFFSISYGSFSAFGKILPEYHVFFAWLRPWLLTIHTYKLGVYQPMWLHSFLVRYMRDRG